MKLDVPSDKIYMIRFLVIIVFLSYKIWLETRMQRSRHQFGTVMRFVIYKNHNLLRLIYNVDAFHARQTKPTKNCIFQFQRVSFSRWAKYFSFGYFEILSLDFPSCQKIKCKFNHFQGNIKLDLCHGRYKMFLMQITK